MKRNLIAALVALGVAGLMYGFWNHFKKRYTNDDVQKTSQLLSQMETQGIPAFELKTLDGQVVSSDVIKGKLAFVNFWASWCDPCVREFPSMLSLVKHFKGELILIAISNDEDSDDMSNFIKAFEDAEQDGVYILWDKDRKIADKFGTKKLPETYMVGPDLKLIRKIVGIEKWYTPSSIKYMEDMIGSYKKKDLITN